MLKINGVSMPEPSKDGLSITRNKIWSSNTGRTADGTMVGDLVSIKYKLVISWSSLTLAQASVIDNVISNAFFTVEFIDPASGNPKTIDCYAGDASYSVYTYRLAHVTYKSVSVDLIEK